MEELIFMPKMMINRPAPARMTLTIEELLVVVDMPLPCLL
jgi:hypothetical protein